MKTYIVRVQLSNGTPENYSILKNALLKAGFSKKITSQSNVKYTLPNGNYLGESDKKLAEILSIVQSIVMKIGDKNAMILVTEAGGDKNAWYNLPR